MVVSKIHTFNVLIGAGDTTTTEIACALNIPFATSKLVGFYCVVDTDVPIDIKKSMYLQNQTRNIADPVKALTDFTNETMGIVLLDDKKKVEFKNSGIIIMQSDTWMFMLNAIIAAQSFDVLVRITLVLDYDNT